MVVMKTRKFVKVCTTSLMKRLKGILNDVKISVNGLEADEE
jgi:hypothetical protein